MDVYVVGVGSTPFKRQAETDNTTLCGQALNGALADAGLEGTRVDSVVVSNCAMHAWGQANIRGQAALSPILAAATLNPAAPIANVEAGCASGGLAFRQAALEVAAGQAGVVLALGVEKMWYPQDPARMVALFDGGVDQLHADEWKARARALAAELGVVFEPVASRSIIMDLAALMAAHALAHGGVTLDGVAQVAAKSRSNGVLNPLAQLQKPTDAAAVLKDAPVLGPLTRSMCAPVSDGAAAAVLVSRAVLDGLDASVRQRAVRVRAVAASTGDPAARTESCATVRAAKKAYASAGMGAADIHVAEVHDATAFSEVLAYERLGFCAPREGSAYALSGATARDGARPVNTSGGLLSKGHPLGATGLAMVAELSTQLRGQAGARQVKRAVNHALFHNAGGMLGLDEAAAVVGILSI